MDVFNESVDKTVSQLLSAVSQNVLCFNCNTCTDFLTSSL